MVSSPISLLFYSVSQMLVNALKKHLDYFLEVLLFLNPGKKS